MTLLCYYIFFFFNYTATTEIYTLSLHDALPISLLASRGRTLCGSRHHQSQWTALWSRRTQILVAEELAPYLHPTRTDSSCARPQRRRLSAGYRMVRCLDRVAAVTNGVTACSCLAPHVLSFVSQFSFLTRYVHD